MSNNINKNGQEFQDSNSDFIEPPRSSHRNNQQNDGQDSQKANSITNIDYENIDIHHQQIFSQLVHENINEKSASNHQQQSQMILPKPQNLDRFSEQIDISSVYNFAKFDNMRPVLNSELATEPQLNTRGRTKADRYSRASKPSNRSRSQVKQSKARQCILNSYQKKKKMPKEQRKQIALKRSLTTMSRLSIQMQTMNINNQNGDLAIENDDIRCKSTRAQKLQNRNEKSIRQMPNRVCNDKEKIIYNEQKMSVNNIIKDKSTNRCANREVSRVTKVPKETILQQEYDETDPFAQVTINQKQDEEICDICLGDEAADDDDMFVFCEMCNLVVHQTCYGGELQHSVPRGDWICRRCQHCMQQNVKCIDIQCELCPDIKGAMKYFKKQKIWAHITCVNWIPEVYFKDETKEEICGQFIKSRQTALFCRNCRVKRGANIQCDYKKCHRNWHVRCAMRRGVIPDCDKFEDLTEKNPESWGVPIFCEQHRQEGEKAFMNNDMERIQRKSVKQKRKTGNQSLVGQKRSAKNIKRTASKSVRKSQRQKSSRQKSVRNKSIRSSVSITRNDRSVKKQKKKVKFIEKQSKKNQKMVLRSKRTKTPQIQKNTAFVNNQMQQLQNQMSMLLNRMTINTSQPVQNQPPQKKTPSRKTNKSDNVVKKFGQPAQSGRNVKQPKIPNSMAPQNSLPFHAWFANMNNNNNNNANVNMNMMNAFQNRMF